MKQSQHKTELNRILTDQLISIDNVTFTKRRFHTFNSWVDFVFDEVEKTKF